MTGIFVIVAVLLSTLFFSTPVDATCVKPNISKDFLDRAGAKDHKWFVSDAFFYKDPELGFSFDILSPDTSITFYIYDLGIAEDKDKNVDAVFSESVQDMLKRFALDKAQTSSPFIIPTEAFGDANNFLVHNAVLVALETDKSAVASMISVGFDGNCFLKIRFTKNLKQDGSDIKTYFNNPFQNSSVLSAANSFVGFANILNEELVRIGYYKK